MTKEEVEVFYKGYESLCAAAWEKAISHGSITMPMEKCQFIISTVGDKFEVDVMSIDMVDIEVSEGTVKPGYEFAVFDIGKTDLIKTDLEE